jgi:glutaredoxin 3
VQGEKAKVGVDGAVQGAIHSISVVVFSKSYCPYCKAAKELLKQLNIEHKAFEMDEIDRMEDQGKMFQSGRHREIDLHLGDGKKMQDYLLEYTKQRTVPNIFINGANIRWC